MAPKGTHQFLLALIAQLTPAPATVWLRRPTAGETDYPNDWEIVPHGGVHLHGVHAKRAIAVEYQHGFVRLSSLRTHPKGDTDSHSTKGTRIETMPWRIRWDGLT